MELDLTEAIEAAARATGGHAISASRDGWACACGAGGSDRDLHGAMYRHLVEIELRAAAPTIERAAVTEALQSLASGVSLAGVPGVNSAEHAEAVCIWLLERAKGGTDG